MTITAPTTPTDTAPQSNRRSSGGLAGTGALVRFMLRRDRVRMPAWVGGFALFVLYLTAALPTAFETDEDLESGTELLADPVGRMFTGPGYGFDAPTYERLIANGYSAYMLVLAALMSILLVARHTRMEEQTGRAELLRANVVGRHAALTATAVVAIITNIAAAAAVFVAMVGVGGHGALGSLLLGAAVGAAGLAFAGITSVTAQLTEYSRAAAGMAGAVLGAAFALRASGDLVQEGGSLLSWLSPLGWGQQTAPFVLDRWWPLALLLALAAVTTTCGYVLSTRRDFGASLFAVRPGPARAAPSLGQPLGLAVRLQRASILGWATALVIGGLVYGAFADALEGAIDDMPDAYVDLFGEDDLLAGYLGYTAVFMTFLVAAFAILAVQGLRAEETSGRAEPVLATPISRRWWLGSNLMVSTAAVIGLAAVTGLATGIGASIVTGEVSYLWELIIAQLNHVPAVLVVLGIAAVVYATLPRAIPLMWALIGYGVIVGTFGPMLDLPQTAYNLSLFEHTAEMPLEAFTLAPVLILTAAAILAAVLGSLALQRRDLDVN